MKKLIRSGSMSLCIALVLLAVTEVVLRLFVEFPNSRLTTEVTYDRINWWQLNRSYLSKYFSVRDALIPELKPVLFRKEKHANMFRILCFGESSMFGTPYEMTANIPGILRKQLRHAYPDREFEVINCGASAINSNVILDLAKQLVQYSPDLVIVYMGHNEFYGPDGLGASFFQRTFPVAIPLKYLMKELRVVQFSAKLLGEGHARGQSDKDPNMMRQVSHESNVFLDSDHARRIFQLFKSNLKAMMVLFKQNNVPVIVSDVSSNLMFPPFAYDSVKAGPGPGITASMETFRYGHYRELYEELKRWGDVDSTNAFVNYWLGRTLVMLGRTEEAKVCLTRARDYDLLKFRAPSEINRIIHTVCGDEHIPCISTDSMFSRESPYGIPGDTLFWEHLHPTAYGYYQIANLFFDEIGRLKLVADSNRSATSFTRLPFQTDSLSICWLDLAYADLSIQHLIGRWPFDNYERTLAVVGTASVVLKQIVQETYSRKLVWDQGCYQSAAYFWKVGARRDAMTTYEAIIEESPFNFYAHYLLGN